MERSKISKVALKWQKIAGIAKIASIKLRRTKSFALYESEEDEEVLRWRRTIPQGHVAVYAGKEERKRFVIPVGYLNHGLFRELLVKAEEEYGFNYGDGKLTIPCEPSVLDRVIRMLREWQDHEHENGGGDALDINSYGPSPLANCTQFTNVDKTLLVH